MPFEAPEVAEVSTQSQEAPVFNGATLDDAQDRLVTALVSVPALLIRYADGATEFALSLRERRIDWLRARTVEIYGGDNEDVSDAVARALLTAYFADAALAATTDYGAELVVWEDEDLPIFQHIDDAVQATCRDVGITEGLRWRRDDAIAAAAWSDHLSGEGAYLRSQRL